MNNFLVHQTITVILIFQTIKYLILISIKIECINISPILTLINDLHEGISTDTHIALYADDTKIWRSIKNEQDIVQSQRDINILYFWLHNNEMKFNPDKCKVVTIKHRPSPLAMLPFVAYHYHLGENLLSYADSEKDLGVLVNKSFNFNEQCEILLTKANQKFAILKRTCHFVTCKIGEEFFISP